MNFFYLSRKNLSSKPLSTFLSLMLFALGISLITILLLLNHQFQKQFDKNLAGIDLVIGAKGSPLQLILSGMYHLDAPTGNIPITEIQPFLRKNHPLISDVVPLSLGDSYKGFRIVGTTPDFFNLYEGALQIGRVWTEPMQAVIGFAVAQKLNLQIGDTFQSSHGLKQDDDLIHEGHQPIHIIGILKPSGTVMDQLLVTDFRTVWEVHNNHHPISSSMQESSVATLASFTDQSITTLLIKLKSRNFQALNFQRNINENTNLQAATPAIEINRLYANIGLGISLLKALAIAIVLVSGISIFVSLYNSLKDRKYEMALMRVMGGSRFKLFKLVLLEGFILAGLGWLLGIILGHIGLEMIAHSLESTYKYSISGFILIGDEWYILGASILIGILASFVPAIEAARTNIHQTLSEGK